MAIVLSSLIIIKRVHALSLPGQATSVQNVEFGHCPYTLRSPTHLDGALFTTEAFFDLPLVLES